jgi:hypothetical protein
MLYAYVQRFNVTGNMQNFLGFLNLNVAQIAAEGYLCSAASSPAQPSRLIRR